MSTGQAAPILEARDLRAGYGAAEVLRGISIRVRAGETVGLMGRNGMGKSTLIRTLMGVLRPTSGDVLIDGKSAQRTMTFERARAGIAYVPEGRGIFASLSVRENLTIAARTQRVSPGTTSHPHWTLDRVLDRFPRLGQRMANLGDQLSGGEQQMLAIGRALMTNPRLLILDEATEGLAPIIRDEIWSTLRDLRGTGLASLIVDKTVAEVTAVADRIVVLVKGAIAWEGAAGELTRDAELMHRHLGV